MNKCIDCKYFIHTTTGKQGGIYGYCDLKDEKFKRNRSNYVYWRYGHSKGCTKFEASEGGLKTECVK